MSATNCVFCKIIRGEIPSHSVYEDDRVLVFLDVGPVSRGHTLVIPKAHAERLEGLDPEDAAAIGRVLPRVGRAVLEGSGASDYNVLQNNGETAGQAVGHVHFHVIPRHSGTARDPVDAGSEGLPFAWPAGSLATGEGEQLAAAIRQRMSHG